ncbi:PadR family transcriptional regulator [Amycolatopsis sp. 195334CR]|uniref:PadR family transcriptional regulator n=1 Tax=Amycolatopsis sp. 195334CR TaxID=2814588 RepID=UPI001A8CD1D8|nr:PadR family transcriptional regulator [Amycolatopsis sp. 195334CR]MBN6033365.1 PadR family transcriptional regulator [Amycolatopsis sp. 195334CR]
MRPPFAHEFGRRGGFGPRGPFEDFAGGWGFGGPRGRGRGPGGPHRHGGRRGRRGDVRAAILLLLAEQPRHGYEIITEIGERSDGLWKPSPGSIYPTLQLLADEGLVSASEEGGKRLFQLTDEGRAAAERLDTPPWETIARDVDPNEANLRSASMTLMAAVFQVAQAGTAEQQAKAVQALNEARRTIYGVLGEVESDTADEETE